MKGKLKINKGAVAALLAGTILVGSAVGHAISTTTDEQEGVRVENEVGHDDFIPLPFLDVDHEDFVVLDVGNHNWDGVLFQDYKMKYCNDNDISLGIVISPDTSSEAAIFDDVEYVKGLLSEYNVSFPVYLNIDTLMEDTSLSPDLITKYANDFLKKCADNHIYVGVYGTDSNLCRFKEHTGIDSYDAFVIQDQEKIQYDGTYYVVKDLDGNIKSSTDLAFSVAQNGNNTTNGFVYDSTHIIADGETILDVALDCGLSVDDLLAFNNISEKDAVSGKEIRIPNVVSSTPATEFVTVQEPLRGADLSYAQGTGSDWNQLSENFDFLIFKVSEGLSLDETFNHNIQNANTYGIPAGAYCYNAYHLKNTDSMDDFLNKQRQQADFVIQNLKDKKIDYPVYLDVELPSGASWNEMYNSEYISSMLNLWVEKMEQAGYTPGLYCNQSGLDFIQSSVNYNLSDRLELWVAGGDQYMSGKEDIPFEDVRPSSILEDNAHVAMAQSTDSAVGAGAGNGAGHLDINFSEVDYAQSDGNVSNADLLAIKEFTHLPLKEVGIGAAGVGFVVGAGIIGAKIRKKGKEKAKTKAKSR